MKTEHSYPIKIFLSILYSNITPPLANIIFMYTIIVNDIIDILFK